MALTDPRRRVPIGVAAAVVFVIACTAFYWWRTRASSGRLEDEARRVGYTGFTPPAEDYFQAMDGAVDLAINEAQGRNLWMVYSGGNDRFWDRQARESGGGFDLLKIVSSYNPETDPRASSSQKEKLRSFYGFRHENRFATLGLINEPCYEQAESADPRRYGLWLDRHLPDCPADPFEDASKYPGVPRGARGRDIPTGSLYGAPSGVIGLRLFPNPDFNQAAARRWDPVRYYTDPAYFSAPDLVRPYRVGMTCAFCHAGFHPEHMPADIAKPKWENLSSIGGTHGLRMHRVAQLPQDTSSFVWQLLNAARPGAIDTSLAATDHVFNPRAPGGLWGMPARVRLARTWGAEKLAVGGLLNHQISDYVAGGPLAGLFEAPATVWTPRMGAAAMDSSGVLSGVARWFVDPGMFSEETLFHFNPVVGGKRQSALDLNVLRKNSGYWQFTEQMSVDVVRFLMNTGPPPRAPESADGAAAERGKVVFADRCAACHSSKFPAPPREASPGACSGDYLDCWNRYWGWTKTVEYRQGMEQIAAAPDFLRNNFLSNDLRVPLPLIGSNACTALGGNGGSGELWDNFTSQTYKDLPSAGTVAWYHPDTGEKRDWKLPAGGPGYLRPPSLIAVWTSAPLLANNSVGRFDPDPSPAARLAAFQQAMEELLWPEKRERDAKLGERVPGLIPRTTEVSMLRVPAGRIPDELGRVLERRLGLFGADSVEIGPIPAGTPVGLLANLNLMSEKAVPLLLRLKREPFANLVDAMLEVSACPDLVVNRGHYFGTGLDGEPALSDRRKLDLIEFLKTF